MKIYNVEEVLNGVYRNERRAKCFCCSCTLQKNEGYRVVIPSRGIRVVCSQHYNESGLLYYHGNANNNEDVIIGTEKKTPLASTFIGVEIECKNVLSREAFTTLRALVESCFECHMEHDGSVDGEMPTSKMRGLATISKVLQSMEMHGLMDIVNNEACGAHIHVNCNDVLYCRRYYHSIFLPLAEYINGMNTNRRIKIFGSDFRYYARMISIDSDPLAHANIFNMQHENTIEFRLPRITGYKQYMRLLKFWRECGCFINYFDFDKNNLSNTVRKAKARECGEALVDIAKKYFE